MSNRIKLALAGLVCASLFVSCRACDSSCAGLGPKACATRPGCAAIEAWPVDDQRTCVRGTLEPVGCGAAGRDAPSATTWAVDPDGACWEFPSLDVPRGWSMVDECPEYAGETVPFCENAPTD